jgi:hypothetical protein
MDARATELTIKAYLTEVRGRLDKAAELPALKTYAQAQGSKRRPSKSNHISNRRFMK